jgi:hypothetical protein
MRLLSGIARAPQRFRGTQFFQQRELVLQLPEIRDGHDNHVSFPVPGYENGFVRISCECGYFMRFVTKI